MIMNFRKRLTTAIFFEITTVIIVTVMLLGYLWINREYQSFNEESEEMKNQYIDDSKQTLQSEVNRAVDYINYMKAQTDITLKNDLKERTYEEYQIAMNIYNQNKSFKSEAEIKKMIMDALRNVRFNDGRGYYFIDTLKGEAILYPTNAAVEGKSILSLQDGKGSYSAIDEINLVNKQGEGYITGYWPNPEYNDDKLYEKITFVKKFEPYNWYIGTGEYETDVENQLKKEALDRIGKIRFGKDTQDYVFVDTYTGTEICNGVYPSYVGKNIWNLTDADGFKIIQQQTKIARTNINGGFLTHYWKKPNSTEAFEKLTFVRAIPDWNWVVGSGIDMEQLQNIIDSNKKNMENKVIGEIKNISLILIGVLFFAFIMNTYITNKNRKNFKMFAEFLYESSKKYKKLDIDKLEYFEFKELAKAANEMIEEINKNTIKIKERNIELHKMLITDGLTELYNHKYMYERIEFEVNKSEKFSIAMFDIDYFKKINDSFGHQVGDIVLKRIANIIKENVLAKDLPGRYGGEEFIILMPETKIEEAFRLAENIRLEIMQENFEIGALKVTISGGISEYKGGTAMDIVKMADEKLYLAKENGRNRIER